ncbi:MAG: exodeoxyribonuclease VII large subunit [Geminicoccaceae bacterium]
MPILMQAATSNLPEYTVTELSFALKRTVEESYALVRVRGELSGYKRAGSGHQYFTLKDDRSCLDAVVWKGSLGRLGFEPADGLEVICTGRLTTYPGRSKYQIVIERMEPAGAGALMALLEERRRKLAAEGLFDDTRKRPLPFLPEIVGVVTSPTGAVIRDILHRIGDRFPRHVLVWPVLVQGEGAAEQVAAAIRGFNALPPGGRVPRPHVLIVARGGGSIEDLWAFNEEVVVRAAATSAIPLISAVGHETDVTLIDHAADRRAPTPTAAAEMAVPVRRELVVAIQGLGDRLRHGIERQVAERRQRLTGLARGLPRPEMTVGMAAQRLDDLAERLRLRSPLDLVKAAGERVDLRLARIDELARDRLREAKGLLATVGGRLRSATLQAKITQLGPPLAREAVALDRAMAAVQEKAAQRLSACARHLDALSHTRVLERGYAIVRAGTGGPVVPRRAALGAEADLTIVFVDGETPVRRTDLKPKRASAPSGPGQGTLL